MELRTITANQIVTWVVLSLGLALALVMGSAVGNSEARFVAGIIAVIPLAVIFAKLKTNIWVLLPIGWSLSGNLPWLPLPLSVRNLCFLVVIGVFILFVATRAFPWKRKVNMLDYLIYINLGYLVTVYARNPAGFWFMQSSMVGGRPYFEIVLAFGAFMILSRVHISDFIATVFPLFFVVPSWLVGIVDTMGRIDPKLGYVVNNFYSGVGVSGAIAGFKTEVELGTTRVDSLGPAGMSAVLALCSRYNPITFISPLYPWRVAMFATAFGAIFLSGFRSAVLFAFAVFLLSSILRRQLQSLLIAMAAGALVVVLLIALQGSLVQLPFTMQRTLSWLPGDWNPEAVNSGEESTQWRIEMWAWAWNDERIMQNKLWGQGFGFSLEDMSLIVGSMMAGDKGSSLLGGSDRESFMINGTFHSGPLSSIRYIGVVGFSLYYGLMCYMGVLAWQLCKRAIGTKGFNLCLFVGIPIIYEPFVFTVIYGALDTNYPQLLFWAGLLNLTQRYVESLKPIMLGGKSLVAKYQSNALTNSNSR